MSSAGANLSRLARIGFGGMVGCVLLTLGLQAQEHVHPTDPSVLALQPLAQQVRRLETALEYLGQPLPVKDRQAIDGAIARTDTGAAVSEIQAILDRFVLANIHINPESRVKVEQGRAVPELVQGGTRLFLVKVINEAGVTAPLAMQSPNGGRVFITSRNTPEPAHELTEEDVRDRWADISLYTASPMRQRLSGLPIEYVILQIYSRDAGQRSAVLGFNVGQGTGDVGFRSDIDILFTCAPAHPVRVRVVDERGEPTTASFLIKDEVDRIYPTVSKRLAPDFYFQPQVYRSDGQTIQLPTGSFILTV